MTLLKKILSLNVLFGIFFVAGISAQDSQPPQKPVNFGYSRNPKTKSKPAVLKNTAKKVRVATPETESISPAAPDNQSYLISKNKIEKTGEYESYSAASKTLEIAKRANIAAPTEIYKIGVGDVLFISLQNAPSRASTYFTVLGDGTIDYPLARGMVSIAGLTAEEVEDLLREKVKLYENPQISVKVREHASHSITVLGLVEKSGTQFLEREAIPLYVVKAKSIVQPNASQLFIKRAGGAAENVNLRDANAEEILIFPGDILDFKSSETVSDNSGSPQFYYIGGEINSAGQKNFYTGISLTQAILASGGLRKSNVKKVVVRRKNEQGLLSPIEFDLSAIKDGKQPDPILRAGDTIEITK
ncbi:MAG: polysaccharide biosynthesis/export family protein [Acidobacteriota bacterium]|nr:polysaccharide biosynthesis/export family protein [Acidobacteriota bacterium]